MADIVYVRALTGRTHQHTNNGVVSILTYPVSDAAGDYVRPDGGDWSRYPAHPLVNWAHEIPIGRGEVVVKSLRFENKVTPVAVGNTLFAQSRADLAGIDLRRRDPRTNKAWDRQPPFTVDECLKAAAQAQRLVDEQVATGVSIEFHVDPSRKGIDFWDLEEDSLLDNRKARHFHNWTGTGYAHARQPVNPGCHTVLRDLPEHVEKAVRIAQTGKLPGGEALCETILKSFDTFKSYRGAEMVLVPELPKPDTTPQKKDGETVVKSHESGMDIDSDDVSKDTDDKALGDPMEDTTPHGCKAMLNAVQGLMDIATNFEKDAKRSDNKKVRAYAKKMGARVKAMAEEVKGRCELLRKELGDEPETGEDEKSWDDDDAEMTEEEKAIVVDKDGAVIVKSFPDWKPRRYKASDLLPVTNTVSIPAPSTSQKEEESEEYKKAMAELNAAAKRAKTAKKNAQPYIDAAASNGVA